MVRRAIEDITEMIGALIVLIVMISMLSTLQTVLPTIVNFGWLLYVLLGAVIVILIIYIWRVVIERE